MNTLTIKDTYNLLPDMTQVTNKFTIMLELSKAYSEQTDRDTLQRYQKYLNYEMKRKNPSIYKMSRWSAEIAKIQNNR